MRSSVIVIGVLLALPVAQATAQALRPNVVLIYADDLGYGDVSSYGATRVKTPNIDRLSLARDTLVLFTSDNGPLIDDGYRDDAVAKLADHAPAGPFHGGKYSNFEGGTRVPFVVRWPGRVGPGVSDALISQIDLIASFAALVNRPLSDGAAPDSENVLPALVGTSKTARTLLVEQAGSLSLRQGRWKYIAPSKGPKTNQTKTELGNDPEPQLYDLAADPAERINLATMRPEKVQELAALLEAIRRAGPK